MNNLAAWLQKLIGPFKKREETHAPANDPAPSLYVSVDPGTVYITNEARQLSFTDLTITITNTGALLPLPLSAVQIRMPSNLFLPGSEDTLKPVADETQWQIASGSDTFTFQPLPGSTNWLDAGQSYTFRLEKMMLANLAGEAHIHASVTFTGGAEVLRVLPVKMEPAPAGILSFRSIPSVIMAGESATLSWTCSRIDYCSIEPLGPLQLPASGSINVNPATTTVYTLHAFTAGTHLELEWALVVDSGSATSRIINP